MAKISAGILPYRYDSDGRLEVFLVHPGGPFWARKDDGAWSVAKGEVENEKEELLHAALREFKEETGFEVSGDLLKLEPVKQPSGKIVHTWAVNQSFEPGNFKSNEFEMEWPRGSGKIQSFPEIDRVDWFDIPTAKTKSLKGQVPIIEQLVSALEHAPEGDRSGGNSG